MKRPELLLVAGLAVAAAASVCSPAARATPIYAVRSANRCDTCHIEPTNWENPPHPQRKCTLDCAVCHVSPSGGGLRTPSGQYYGREVLPRWGHRPSQTVPDGKYVDEQHPGQKARYRLVEGFTGWQAGDVPAQTIGDRYGDIEPDPKVRFGMDIRAMVYDAIGEDVQVFPMQFEGYAAAFPVDHLTFYTSMGLKSSRSHLDVTGSESGTPATPSALDYFALRELFVMTDGWPHRMYARAGRISPIYGWRLDDHTAYIRRDLGLDVDRQVFGAEVGWNPSYPYLNASVFTQGSSWWPGDVVEPGYGLAISGGYRDLGWQAGGSAMRVWLPNGSDNLVGVQWGLMTYPVTFLGELDFRDRQTDGTWVQSMYLYQEVNWEVQWGITAKLKIEWTDANLRVEDDHRNRFSLGAEFHPWTFVQVEPAYRLTLSGGGLGLAGKDYPGLFLYDMAHQQVGHEVLFMTHVWL